MGTLIIGMDFSIQTFTATISTNVGCNFVFPAYLTIYNFYIIYRQAAYFLQNVNSRRGTALFIYVYEGKSN